MFCWNIRKGFLFSWKSIVTYGDIYRSIGDSGIDVMIKFVLLSSNILRNPKT